jgi:hypothetical protein
MAKPGQVMRLYPDAIEDSLYAAYSLAVIYPLSVLSCQWLLRGGKNTTSLKVDLVSFLVPAFLIAIPLVGNLINTFIFHIISNFSQSNDLMYDVFYRFIGGYMHL